MNRHRIFIFFVLTVLLTLSIEVVSAQKAGSASGSLDYIGDGLWDYYRGMSRPDVKRDAPVYEKLDDNGNYLLDYKKIKGVDLLLTAKFKNNILNVLQITTTFPAYDKCRRETKELSQSFAEIGYQLMGVNFDTDKQCKLMVENGGTMVCTTVNYACVYRLCPGKTWALACIAAE